MTRIIGMAFALSASMSMAAARTNTVNNPTSDWTNPANFTNGKPEDGDTVVIPEKMVVYATNETAQTLLNKLSYIKIGRAHV